MTPARRMLATVVLIGALGPMLFAQEAVGAPAAAPTVAPLPDVTCFSGSPLLLQVKVPDPAHILSEVQIEAPTSSIAYRIPENPERDELLLHVSPFLGPGVYDLEISTRTRDGAVSRSVLQAGFVDFVWGRDNLSFGNNAEYRSVIGTFGEVLAHWVAERFGEVAESDMVLLVDYMYSLFGSNTGRCYAFSGTEVRYWRWPELLPSYYDAAHDLRGNVARYQREMNFLQFDIVFDHFLAGPGSQQILGPMSREEIRAQAEEIAARLAAGEPVAVGFAGPELHHSMLVFGFIHNHTTHTVDLLVANNWKSDEKLNIHSRDAEIVRLRLAPDHEGPIAEWRYEDGVRNRGIDRIFAVDVRRDPYAHERAVLDSLISRLRDDLQAGGRAVVVVEEAAGARLLDGERSTGRIRNRTTREVDGVCFERVGEAHRFTFPATLPLELEVADNTGARVLYVAPGPEPGTAVSSIQAMPAPEEGQTVTLRVSLRNCIEDCAH